MSIDDYPIDVLMEYKRLWEEGNLHEANSNNREAIKCYLKMMKITEPDPIIFNRIAYCHILLNEVDMAKWRLCQSLELDSDNIEALHNLSLILIDEKEYDKAETLIRKAIRLDKSMEGNWHNLGKLKYLKCKNIEAIKALAKAIDLAPERADSHYYMALLHQRMKKKDLSQQSFLRAIELDHENAEILKDYGRFLISIKNLSDASYYLRKAVAADPLDYVSYTLLAESFIEQIMELGNDAPDMMIGETLDTLNKSLSLNVQYPKTWYLWGRMCIMFREWEDAEKYLRAAVEGDCEDPYAWGLLSAVLKKLGRKEESKDMYEQYKEKHMTVAMDEMIADGSFKEILRNKRSVKNE